jgi:hypothetical protein
VPAINYMPGEQQRKQNSHHGSRRPPEALCVSNNPIAQELGLCARHCGGCFYSFVWHLIFILH